MTKIGCFAAQWLYPRLSKTCSFQCTFCRRKFDVFHATRISFFGVECWTNLWVKTSLTFSLILGMRNPNPNLMFSKQQFGNGFTYFANIFDFIEAPVQTLKKKSDSPNPTWSLKKCNPEAESPNPTLRFKPPYLQLLNFPESAATFKTWSRHFLL